MIVGLWLGNTIEHGTVVGNFKLAFVKIYLSEYLR